MAILSRIDSQLKSKPSAKLYADARPSTPSGKSAILAPKSSSTPSISMPSTTSGGKSVSSGKRSGGLGSSGGTTPAAAKAATVEARTRGIGSSAERSVVGRDTPLSSTQEYAAERVGKPVAMPEPRETPNRRTIEWMENPANTVTAPSVVSARRGSEVAQIMQSLKTPAALRELPDTGAIEEKVPAPDRVVVSPDEVPLDDSSMFGGGREGERGRIRGENTVPPAVKTDSKTEPLWTPEQHVGITETWGGSTTGPVKGRTELDIGKGAITHNVDMDLDGTVNVVGKAEHTKDWTEAQDLSIVRKVYEDENK